MAQTYECRRWSETELDIIRTYGTETSTQDLMRMLPGRTYNSVVYAMWKLGLQKSDDFRRRAKTNILRNCAAWREMVGDEAANAAISHTRRAVIKRERARLRMGLAQETNIRFTPDSRKRQQRLSNARLKLRHQGYIIPAGSYVCYYDENTRRTHGRYDNYGEPYWENKYGFRFRPVSEMGKTEFVQAVHLDAPPVIFDL